MPLTVSFGPTNPRRQVPPYLPISRTGLMISGSWLTRSWTGGSLPALTRSASIGASLNVLGYWAGSVMTVAPSSLPTSEVLGFASGLAAAAGAAGLAASVGLAAAAGAAGAAGAVVAAGAAGAAGLAASVGFGASAGFAGAEVGAAAGAWGAQATASGRAAAVSAPTRVNSRRGRRRRADAEISSILCPFMASCLSCSPTLERRTWIVRYDRCCAAPLPPGPESGPLLPGHVNGYGLHTVNARHAHPDPGLGVVLPGRG